MSFVIQRECRIIILALVIIVQACHTFVYSSEPPEIEVTMSLVKEAKRNENSPLLKVALKNNTKEKIEIDGRMLPWAWRYSVLFVAVEETSIGKTIPLQTPVDDPDDRVIVLKPGDRLEGQISVGDRFHGLPEILKRRNIIVFWTYQLESISKKKYKRTGGWFEIPKT